LGIWVIFGTARFPNRENVALLLIKYPLSPSVTMHAIVFINQVIHTHTQSVMSSVGTINGTREYRSKEKDNIKLNSNTSKYNFVN